MWFGMNKAIMIGTILKTLLVWIWIFVVLDHNDVTCDDTKGGVLDDKRKMKQRSWSFFYFWRKEKEELEILAIGNQKLCFDIV